MSIMRRKAAIAQTGNARKIGLTVFAFIIVCFGTPAAFALDTMGLPAAGLRQDEYRLGIDYSYSKMDLDLSEGKYSDYVLHYDLVQRTGQLQPKVLKDLTIHKGYVNLGYGITDMGEVFMRIGGALAEFEGSMWESGEIFNSNLDFSISGGAKVTFYEDDFLKIGGLCQLSYTKLDGIMKPDDWPTISYPGADSVKIEITEMQIAVGPAYEIEDNVIIYGGPFYHYLTGDMENIYTGLYTVENNPAGLITMEYSWSLEEDATYGGYIGTRMKLAENSSLNMEYQLTSAAYCIGTSITWRF